MTTRRKISGTEAAAPVPESAAYAPVLNASFHATASQAQEMHQEIAGTAFGHLQRVPGLSVPTRIVQGVHDAIAQGMFAAVRHSGGAALSVAAGAERLVTDSVRMPGIGEQPLHRALNAAVGDALAASSSALIVKMSLHAVGAPLAVTPASLATLRPRVCVFIHGLACDEHSWALRTDAWAESPWASALPAARDSAPHYGALLEHELGVSAVYLRYNTGLSIDANAKQLAELLERATQAAPQVQEWLLIGHSMGGLIARRAHALAAADGLVWPGRSPMVICLGTPHLGSAPLGMTLEQIGPLAAATLEVSDLTQPPTAPAVRLIFGTLGDESDAVMGPLIGKMFGDGLVLAGSATGEGAAGDVQRVELAGLAHMSLLNHPRVYAEIRRWLGAPTLG